jgi:acylphosphatase
LGIAPTISAPRAARPLLQSRGCKLAIKACHMAKETLARRFHISGRVQGVGFRYFAEDVALRLGVMGYVKNLFDGSVEVYAIGSAPQLDELRGELGRGPRMARVDRLDESDAAMQPEFSSSFTIESEY